MCISICFFLVPPAVLSIYLCWEKNLEPKKTRKLVHEGVWNANSVLRLWGWFERHGLRIVR